MSIDEIALRKICTCAKLAKVKNANAVFCKENCGIPIPNNLLLPYVAEKQTCIATNLYKNGIFNVETDFSKIESCSHRKKY